MEEEFTKIFIVLYSTRGLLDFHHLSESVNEEKIIELTKAAEVQKEELKEFATAIEEMNIQEELQEKEQKAYRFERKIRGGIIPDINAFVPEKIVQDLDLQNGDLVYARLLYKVDDGPDRYEYELVERGAGTPPEGIIEVNKGIVDYFPSLGGFGVSKTAEQDEIIYEGRGIVLPINDDDSDAFKIQRGDIVNLAFYENNPEYTRVRWRYSIEELPTSTAPKATSSSYKKKTDGVKEEVEQIFKGKKICCMGYEPGWPAFREEVEMRGGEFIGTTGREARDSLAAILNRSDCLIMVLGHVGHGGTKWAVPYCKQNRIPFTDIKTFGRSAFVNAADNLLNF